MYRLSSDEKMLAESGLVCTRTAETLHPLGCGNKQQESVNDQQDYEENSADARETIAPEDVPQAIRENIDHAKACNARGIVYCSAGEYDLAIAGFTYAIHLIPDFAEAYNNRGIAYAFKGDHDQAANDYDQAIRLNPNCAEAYNNRGIEHLLWGRHD